MQGFPNMIESTGLCKLGECKSSEFYFCNENYYQDNIPISSQTILSKILQVHVFYSNAGNLKGNKKYLKFIMIKKHKFSWCTEGET